MSGWVSVSVQGIGLRNSAPENLLPIKLHLWNFPDSRVISSVPHSLAMDVLLGGAT